MGPIGYPETSVIIYQSILRNIPEERSSSVDIFNVIFFSLFLSVHITRKNIRNKFHLPIRTSDNLGKQFLGRCKQLNLCDIESNPISCIGQTEAETKFTTQLNGGARWRSG